MKKRIQSVRRRGLRFFLITWVGGTWLVFVLLAAGMSLANFQLHQQSGQLQVENEHLLTNVMLELEILALWREVHSRHQLQPSAFMAADQYENLLAREADSDQEQSLSLLIVEQYGNFKKKALAGNSEGQFARGMAMYSNLQLLRAMNTAQLDETRQTAAKINRISQVWGIGALVVAGLLLLWGSLELWLRIFSPIIALSRTARAIAAGHMTVRAPVLRDDELGGLSETFNAMADAMVEREKERMHFVATVVHDLKSPLVVIGGLAHLLHHKEGQVSAQEQNEWLEEIVKNTRKLEENIAELTDATQASTGHLQLNLEEISLPELVGKIVREHELAENSHILQCEFQNVPVISGDPQKIERVVLNLLSNAVKYSAESSIINLRVDSNRDWVSLQVRDEGVGIAPRDLEKIFIPFVRLEHTQDMAKGTGLGLLSVKKIVEAHGGKVRLSSELGRGTCVEVMFPQLHREKGKR